MKKIEAIIRPEKLNDVKKALDKAGYPGMMISEIEGHGNQKGITQQWRGEIYKMDLVTKVKVEIVVYDQDVNRLTQAIAQAAKTGQVGDGKIFVYHIRDAVRIRTREKGEKALA